MDIYDSPEFTALVEISRLANSLQNVMDMGMDNITSRQWLPLTWMMNSPLVSPYFTM